MRTMLVAACVGAVSVMQAAESRAAEPQAPTAVVENALDTRVTVRVKGVPLADFLDSLSSQAKVNFIITEGLESKRITAFLKNVTAREALQILLDVKGVSYQQIGKTNTYVITPRSRLAESVITRIYSLTHVQLDSACQQQAEKSAGGGEAAIVAAMRSVLSKQGRLVPDSRTNSIVVTDMPEVFPRVEQVLAELDMPARNAKGQ